MKNNRLIAAVLLFAGVIVIRIFLPNVGTELRTKLSALFSADPAYAAFFYNDEQAEPAQATEAVLRSDEAEDSGAEVSAGLRLLHVNEAEQHKQETPTLTPCPTAALELPPMPEQTAEPLPEAVEVFLESQSVFANYSIPENVNYHYLTLPFAYVVPVAGYNSSGFGYRLHPILETVRFHYGTDFAAWTGEQVLAFADGTVSYAGYDDSFGWHLKIDHGDGWETLYAHCSQLNAAWGQQVRSGECVALVGASGLATGPHLHFELTHDGEYLNPEYYINR